jgi:hypothetical protein
MARRQIIKRTPKIVRTTRSEQYLVNKKYLGDEPVFTKPLTKIEYINALNWYSYMCDTNDAKEYICEYLKNTGRPDDAKRFKRLSDIHVPTTVAWCCRLIQRGCKIPTDVSGYITERIGEALLNVTDVVEEEDTPKVSVQDRMREKAHDILGEVEGLIDDHMEGNTDFSFYYWLTENNIPSVYVGRIIAKLTPVLGELLETAMGKDEQLKEGYRHLNKKELKALITFFDGMISDADRYANNAKKTRSPRKPRMVSTEKKIKNLKWQKEDATYKIASILPEKIINSQELWTFNTKYKTITVLRSQDRGGLQVKGTSITNFDPQNSYTRGTGRKTEDTVRRVLDGGKIVLRKIMDELKTEKALAYRINENTILLRVVS